MRIRIQTMPGQKILKSNSQSDTKCHAMAEEGWGIERKRGNVERWINGAYKVSTQKKEHILSPTQCFCYYGLLLPWANNVEIETECPMNRFGKRVNNGTSNSNSNSSCPPPPPSSFFWHAEHGRTMLRCYFAAKIKSNDQDMGAPKTKASN